MNNPGIKRLAKELQEIQVTLKFSEINSEDSIDENGNSKLSESEENCIEANPLKVQIIHYTYTYKYTYTST